MAYDSEMMRLMQSILEDVWRSLSVDEQQTITKTEIAIRVVRAADAGLTDPAQLREAAIISSC